MEPDEHPADLLAFALGGVVVLCLILGALIWWFG